MIIKSNNKNHRKEFGKIFQIKDDMLGIWGDEKTGKPVGADIKRKKSLPFFMQLITLRIK